MEQDNGEQPSSLSSPPKPIIVRPIKHPTDLIGWLFVGCECPEPVIGSPIIDPADRIGWLFLKDQDNGERSLLLLPTKPAIIRPITHPTDLIGWLFLKDKDDGGRHRDFAFQPGIPVPDVLLRPLHGYHEYIGVYELAGCDYSCDEHGMLHVLPDKYICKSVDVYKQTFGCSSPTNTLSPLETGCLLDFETSELLYAKRIKRYQSLIGSVQSAVSLGCMDIVTVVKAMPPSRAVPRHFQSANHTVAYLSKMSHVITSLCTNENDFWPYGTSYHDWMGTAYSDCKDDVRADALLAYGDCMDDVPTDAPGTIGRFVTTVHYVGTMISVTSCIPFHNQTPIDAYSTAEMITYGSDVVAARICAAQIIEPQYLGVGYMLGNNAATVKSSTLPETKSLHKVQEAIAARMGIVIQCNEWIITASTLNKPWGNQQDRPM
jgi:hypothetical protein